MDQLKQYIQTVLVELRKDDKFIQHLKNIKARTAVPLTSIEAMVGEWFKTRGDIKPDEKRIALRVAIDKFPEMYAKSRGDVGVAKRMLYSTLNNTIKKKPIK